MIIRQNIRSHVTPFPSSLPQVFHHFLGLVAAFLPTASGVSLADDSTEPGHLKKTVRLPVSTGTTGGLEKVLAGLIAGQTIEVTVIAYNDGGDAPPSPTRSLVVT